MDRKYYLLNSQEAREIYKEIKGKGIVDLHTHLDAQWLSLNQGWQDIWDAWCSSDHYVWELMRRVGIPERLITGNASNKEKWLAFAQAVPEFAGNPVYDWLHLDLRLQFNIEEEVNAQTAPMVWVKTKEAMGKPTFRPAALLKAMNVEALCTTETSFSDLKYHTSMKEIMPVPKVLPAWRPDDLLQVESVLWRTSLIKLAEKTDTDLSTLQNFLQALEKLHTYFSEHGAFSSDHALDEPYGIPVTSREAATVYDSLLVGKHVDVKKLKGFKAFLLFHLGELNVQARWVMQLHIGAVRDYRAILFESIGKDAGGDVADHSIEIIRGLKGFLNAFDQKLLIILYVLHPSHVYTIATIARAFPNVFIGAPWWFMDNPYHIREQLLQIAGVDLLSKHIGMVSDSRKLLSIQSRMDIFRRVLSNVLGDMVREGRMCLRVAQRIAEKVAYQNQKDLFSRCL